MKSASRARHRSTTEKGLQFFGTEGLLFSCAVQRTSPVPFRYFRSKVVLNGEYRPRPGLRCSPSFFLNRRRTSCIRIIFPFPSSLACFSASGGHHSRRFSQCLLPASCCVDARQQKRSVLAEPNRAYPARTTIMVDRYRERHSGPVCGKFSISPGVNLIHVSTCSIVTAFPFRPWIQV
jgi:hypothetical protein